MISETQNDVGRAQYADFIEYFHLICKWGLQRPIVVYETNKSHGNYDRQRDLKPEIVGKLYDVEGQSDLAQEEYCK